MNFLGHLYFSGDDHETMLLNLYGDFVKGKLKKIENNKLRKAVELHRKIDSYIDTHETVLKLKLELYKDLPKVAGVAIDIYFDHLLSKNWEQFHTIPLRNYLQAFFENAFQRMEELEQNDEIKFKPFFKLLLKRIDDENWILNYKNEEGLNFACQGLSKRISFENNLDEGVFFFKKNQQKIESVFQSYMVSAQKKFLFAKK